MSMWGSSMWVGKAHSTNQVPNFRTYGWTACAAPTLPPPIEPTPLAIDDEQGRPPSVPQLREPDQEDSVSPTERSV